MKTHIRQRSWNPLFPTRSVSSLATSACALLLTFSLLLSSGDATLAGPAVADEAPAASYGCTGAYHVVRAGETIGSIARRYGSSAYRIAACNGLSSYTVYVGQSLLVPTGARRGAWQMPPLPIDGTNW